MKKKFFPFVLFALCLTSTMFSCQEDEAELGAQAKVDLLMTKSREFAKKYGVDVSLNRDYVEKHADEMTIETMEADYRGFAEMKANSPKQNMNAQMFVPTRKLSKKSFIRRRKVETETITPDMSNQEGIIEDFNTLNLLCCGGHYLHYSATAEWKSENGAIGFVLTKVKLECASPNCKSADIKCCETCQCVDEFNGAQKVNAQGMIIDGKANFSGTCEVGSLSVCEYTFNHVIASISYTEGSGGSVSLSIM